MTEKDILDAWAHIRRVDTRTPDEVLDFMKDSAISILRASARLVEALPKGQPGRTMADSKKIFKRVEPVVTGELCRQLGHIVSEFDDCYCLRCGYFKEPG